MIIILYVALGIIIAPILGLVIFYGGLAITIWFAMAWYAFVNVMRRIGRIKI